MGIDKIEKFDENSSLPKHRQLADLILENIEKGVFKKGQRIPSINETSFDFLVSKDTVEKAYQELKEMGILTAVRGKGFYVTKTKFQKKPKALLLFSKLDPFLRTTYHSIIKGVNDRAVLDIHLHHCNLTIFSNLIRKYKGMYDFYVIVPQFFDGQQHVEDGFEVIRKLANNQVLILDQAVLNHEKEFAGIYQDYEKDIFSALETGLTHLKKYKKLNLVFPKDRLYPLEIIKGFKKFAFFHEFENHIIDAVDETDDLEKGEIYLVISDTDMVQVVKKCREQGLDLGKDIGLIAYYDSPLKEILADGITAISADFGHMGSFIAQLITGEEILQLVKCPAKLIMRNSL
ncbi:GntR family transcriptional regulator [Pararhodonellum marinum]|uniref:GntR family transcriptional regulator n=1 Tax=Pararhodonellum marinum TaxID=2755358 RepID=UPI00189055F4|nr:GntR family transcriptional regulator [Pararhodonellum marinum]